MAKRKSEEAGKKSDRSESDLPKRIRTYLETSSSSDPCYRVKESEKIVDEILKSPEVVARVRSILKRKVKVSPEVVKKAKAILKQRSEALNLQAEISSSDSESSGSSQSDILSIAHSSISCTSEDTSVVQFRLLEKNLKAMEVDLEAGHVKSIRIEVCII